MDLGRSGKYTQQRPRTLKASRKKRLVCTSLFRSHWTDRVLSRFKSCHQKPFVALTRPPAPPTLPPLPHLAPYGRVFRNRNESISLPLLPSPFSATEWDYDEWPYPRHSSSVNGYMIYGYLNLDIIFYSSPPCTLSLRLRKPMGRTGRLCATVDGGPGE